jgi:SAM-dependent methyltransferase
MSRARFCIVTEFAGTARDERETDCLRQAGYDVVVHPLRSSRRLPPQADVYHAHGTLATMLTCFVVAKARRRRYVADFNDAISTVSAGASSEYYEQEGLWNREETERDAVRIDAIRGMIPDDVHTMLEIGCGNGVITNKLEQDVVGLDVSRTALRYVEKPCVQAAAGMLPFRKDSFDLVLSAETLEHLPPAEYETAKAEMLRVARRYILVELPYMQNLGIGMEKCPKCGHKFHANHHYRRYSLREIRGLFGRKASLRNWTTCGIKQPWFHPLLLVVKQRVGGRWAKSPFSICPRCGTRQNPTGFFEINAVVRWCNRRNQTLAAKREPFDSQICALFEARAGANRR